MIPVLDCVSATQPSSYPDILGLDSKIRSFDVPARLQMVDSEGVSSNEAMQQAMTSCTRDTGECILDLAAGPTKVPHCTALLHLHRNYVMQALNSPDFTVKHRYAPSVLAVYLSASNVIWTVDTLFSWEPTLSTRFTVFWSNCFSAAVRSPVNSSFPCYSD